MPSATAEKTWETCLTQISNQISKQSFRTWFAPIRLINLEENQETARLRLAVPNAFHTEWLESHYATVVRKTAAEVIGRQTNVAYEVAPDVAAEEKQDEPAVLPLEPVRQNREYLPRAWPAAPAPSGRPAPPIAPIRNTSLKPEYTFDSFIEGHSNRFARGGAVAIAEDPKGTGYNPFTIYGDTGLGKTHLVQAIGNYALQKNRNLRVHYVSGEQFTSQFIHSIQENRVHCFSNFYRQIDLLIVDDVQFLGGKEKTQEEFFHIFNELHQRGKKIILCADRPPSAITGIQERLLSRFQWGLSADIQPPELETRIAILQHKAVKMGVSLRTEVLEFVAERIRANIRQLEGALNKLCAYVAHHRQDIDVNTAKGILRDLMEDCRVRLEIEDIQRCVAQFYGIEPDLLSAKTRKREAVTARHLAMYFCKELTSHSLKSIGNRFGGRDHSTVIHACRAVRDRMELEDAFRDDMAGARERLERYTPGRAVRQG